MSSIWLIRQSGERGRDIESATEQIRRTGKFTAGESAPNNDSLAKGGQGRGPLNSVRYRSEH